MGRVTEGLTREEEVLVEEEVTGERRWVEEMERALPLLPPEVMEEAEEAEPWERCEISFSSKERELTEERLLELVSTSMNLTTCEPLTHLLAASCSCCTCPPLFAAPRNRSAV